MSPRRATTTKAAPAKRAPAAKRPPAKRTRAVAVPPVDTTVRRPAAKAAPMKRVIPATATPKKGGPVSAPVKSAFAGMKVYSGQDFREAPKVIDPEVWKLATFVLEKGEPGVVDVEEWSSDDERKFKGELEKCKTHEQFDGARFYCKRGLLKNGHEALRVTLSFPGRGAE